MSKNTLHKGDDDDDDDDDNNNNIIIIIPPLVRPCLTRFVLEIAAARVFELEKSGNATCKLGLEVLKFVSSCLGQLLAIAIAVQLQTLRKSPLTIQLRVSLPVCRLVRYEI
jgi:hypothetical protein